MPCVMAVLGAVMTMCMAGSDSYGYEARSVNTMGFRLLQGYRKADPNGNVVFSPTTISAAFAMAHAGGKQLKS